MEMVIMAGMFYSLKEAAQKLGLTEDAVKQLAEEGKLREFRDGSNLLFKIDEVNALLAESPDMEMDLGLEPDEGGASTQELLGLEPVAEEAAEQEPSFGLDLEAEAEPTPAPEGTADLQLSADAEATSELEMSDDLTEEEPAEASGAEEDFLVGMGAEEEPPAKLSDEESEIGLAPESGILDSESDITDMDTALTGQGIDVLSKSDADYAVTDDSLAETVGPAGTTGEASLAEIEEDVNLDSFGSGSGLLDLSLQADDTSLGGILDEIYTAEGGEEGAPAAGETDMVEDMTAEAEHVAPEEEVGAPEAMVAAPVAITPAFAEVAPDTQSNMLGMLLFLPLLALLYAAIVVVAAQRGVMPSILQSIQGFVWYIVGGAAFIAVAVSAAAFLTGREKAPKAPKAAKAAKAKKEKAPKEKKAKAEEAPKAEAPKKEKKSFFGKKK